MRPIEFQRLLVAPGVWLVRRRQRLLARWWFAAVSPIVVSLNG